MDVENIDVVIIGAGASGLMAAHSLISSHSIDKVVVLEASNRVGGRLCSVSLPTANGEDKWDLGGQWVGSSQALIMELFKEFGIEVYSQYDSGKTKMIVNNLTDVRTFGSLIPKLGVLELIDLRNIMKKLSSMVNQIPLEDPLKCKSAKAWDQETAFTFIQKNCYFQASRNMLKVLLRSLFGCEASQMSLFFMLYSFAPSADFDAIFETGEGSSQEFCVKGTLYTLIEKLEAAIGKSKVICTDPVTSVQQDSNTGVLVKTEKGRVYHAKHVICAIPPHLVDRIRFEPPLPHYRQQLSQRMPMGNMIKCLAVYRTPFWREMDCSGLSTVILQSFESGPLCGSIDVTTANGSPALAGFIAGEHAIYWSQKTKEDRKEAILKCFVALFGEQARTELVTYEDKDWSEERYVGGCPGSIMQPGCLVYFEHILRKPFGRKPWANTKGNHNNCVWSVTDLVANFCYYQDHHYRVHWAGSETARKWLGYVEGALEAGKRASGDVAACIDSNEMVVPSSVNVPSPLFNDFV